MTENKGLLHENDWVYDAFTEASRRALVYYSSVLWSNYCSPVREPETLSEDIFSKKVELLTHSNLQLCEEQTRTYCLSEINNGLTQSEKLCRRKNFEAQLIQSELNCSVTTLDGQNKNIEPAISIEIRQIMRKLFHQRKLERRHCVCV